MEVEHSQSVLSALDEISHLEVAQQQIAGEMLRAYNASIYPLDFLAIGAANRSLAHCAGFRAMISARNFICAASILRLQIDTVIRFAAAWLVPRPHALAQEVLKGTPISKLHDRAGHRMTDAYLVAALARDHPWMTNVYKQTSGYIHLSEKHIFNCLSEVGEDRQISVKLSSVDESVTDELYLEAIEAFTEATRIFADYLGGWTLTKGHPEKVDELKRVLSGSDSASDA